MQQPTTMRDFLPIRKIGQGSYSSVYKVERISDGCIYALKKIKIGTLSQRERENAVNQIRILASIEHDHIIGYKESFYDQNVNVLCIVMEFADEGDLASIIKRHIKSNSKIDETTIWKAVHNMLEGLSHLHSMKILHRDLKPANVFVQNGVYKLGDLNVSKVNRGGLAYTQTGTPYYASPEVWRDDPYNQKSDIWSLGCIAYEMSALEPPFAGVSMDALNRNIQAGRMKKIPKNYSKELQHFISMCLSMNPSSRPSCRQLIELVKLKLPNFIGSNVLQESNRNLLQTIKMPSNLQALQGNLPKSKYNSHLPNQLCSIPEVCETPRVVQTASKRVTVQDRKENRENIPSTADKARKRSLPRTERASLQILREKIQIKPADFAPIPFPPKKGNCNRVEKHIERTIDAKINLSSKPVPRSAGGVRQSSLKKLLTPQQEVIQRSARPVRKPKLNLMGMPWW